MVRRGKPLRIDGDGEQTRDLIHVKDIIDANIFCMQSVESGKEWKGECLEVGTGHAVSINYVKNLVDKHSKTAWIHSKSRPGDIKKSIADNSELIKIGWEPMISIEEGIERCFGEKMNKKRSYYVGGS